jgi:hypothetical protein
MTNKKRGRGRPITPGSVMGPIVKTLGVSTLRELAELLGVSYSAVRNANWRGIIPPGIRARLEAKRNSKKSLTARTK